MEEHGSMFTLAQINMHTYLYVEIYTMNALRNIVKIQVEQNNWTLTKRVKHIVIENLSRKKKRM